MTDPLTPSDSRQIQNEVVAWLEANLTDPYEQATSKTRTGFVKKDQYSLSGEPPILAMELAGFDPIKIATQTKTAYLEEEQHDFMIYYYNQIDHRFTFADDSLTLSNEAQCMKYLQYVKNTLKTNMATFATFHKHAFGKIPQPLRRPRSSLWISMLPFTVFTYRR